MGGGTIKTQVCELRDGETCFVKSGLGAQKSSSPSRLLLGPNLPGFSLVFSMVRDAPGYIW